MKPVVLIDPPIQSMTLADGRRLTWQEFGVTDGKPALYFHGGGSFALEAGIFHREAVRGNVRLIATNRPGAGGSTLCPGRPVSDYSKDLSELLDHLEIGRFACLGESNGGLVTLAVAATLSDRVLGAIPINPTVPWFDPVARRVSACSTAIGYRLAKYAPWLLAAMVGNGPDRIRRRASELVGPPPGTESDVGELQWRTAGLAGRAALLAELQWSSSDWGFDYYSIPVTLDMFCGVHDAQAPFALVLADRNADARFHYFPFGHYGFSHPDTRHRIFDTLCGYFK
jgi:pimeloyl-ACP methyl ester carboxylesterase